MMTEDIAYLSLAEVSRRIRRRELTSETVTRILLERIAHHDPRLNAVLLTLKEQALVLAKRADAEIARGFWRGPLHGVPIGVKDNLWTQGLPTTGGMEVLKDFRPTADATVVRRLYQAGAVLIAKLHMTEGALLAHHPVFGRPTNPWSAAHWTGVSSSGSGVAVAAGYCYAALGTDTGGSIRLPSAANNLSGIKPSWGRVSRHGLLPLAESLDHIGPMARSVEDAALVLHAIAGADPEDPTSLIDPVPEYCAALSRGIDDLVIGIDWKYCTENLPESGIAALRNAVEVFTRLGARIRNVDFPASPEDNTTARSIVVAEAALAHAAHFPRLADRYGPVLRAALEGAAGIDTATLARAYQAKDRFTGRMRAFFRDVDLVLTPALGANLPAWSDFDALGNDLPGIFAISGTVAKFTMVFNLAGIPTLNLPGGFTKDGLPIGIQLAGAALAEPNLLRAGAAFQRTTDFHTKHPPL